MAWVKIFAVRKDVRADTALTDGEKGQLQLTANGGLRVRDDDLNTLMATIDADTSILATSGVVTARSEAIIAAGAAATTEVIAAPAAGHQLWVYGYKVGFPAAAGTSQFKSAATAKWAIEPKALNGEAKEMGFRPDVTPLFKCATAEALNITMVGASATGTGVVIYRDVAV